MADDRLDEILERLAALERIASDAAPRDRDDDGPRRDRYQNRDRGRGWEREEQRWESRDSGRSPCFDERRVVDLIVGLVAEQVEHIVERQLAPFLSSESDEAGAEQPVGEKLEAS